MADQACKESAAAAWNTRKKTETETGIRIEENGKVSGTWRRPQKEGNALGTNYTSKNSDQTNIFTDVKTSARTWKGRVVV